MPESRVCLVVADENGELFEIPELLPAGGADAEPVPVEPDEWIDLPEGSDLFHLPGRLPVGYEAESGQVVTLEEYGGNRTFAAAASVAPAHTLFHHPAYEQQEDAPILPLYAYCLLGWKDGRFVVPAVRVDPDIRQDHDQYETSDIEPAGEKILARFPGNRLARHLVDNCLLSYGCPAARNFALGRWEMPLPTSRGCNSACFGCISEQPEEGVAASQDRIAFIPTAGEIAEIAIPHLEKAERPVASFGQGCEGEPLSNPALLEQAIRAIRAKTGRGTLNMNTNASRPKAIEQLFNAGLDSIRVSVNSLQPDYYNKYYRPRGYTFLDVLESLHVSRRMGKFASINYLVFPGITDTDIELERLLEVIHSTGLDMIQWRNLNIDPREYRKLMQPNEDEPKLGLRRMMQIVREECPQVRFGYFNPCLDETK
jgi:pyruvate-formate lyase-activating enzyme